MQTAPAGMVAPLTEKLVAPGVLVVAPTVHAPLSMTGFGLLASTMPTGKVSVSVTPLRGTEPAAVLFTTSCIWETPPPLTVAGTNALFRITSVAVADETVSSALGLVEQV